jgi:hypothetical protein
LRARTIEETSRSAMATHRKASETAVMLFSFATTAQTAVVV